jgi:hypothetical protein
MDPTSNRNQTPSDHSFWRAFKRNYLEPYPTITQIAQGALLGGWTTMLLNPGLYAVNMAMIGQKFVLKDSFRGVLLNSANVVPQTAVQVTIYNLIMKRYFPNKNEQELSLSDKLFCSTAAGGLSGFSTATGEMVVLNYQKQKVLTLTVPEIFKKAYHAGGVEQSKEISEEKPTFKKIAYHLGGIKRCQTGALPLGGREVVWASTYLVLGPVMSVLWQAIFGNKHVCDILGAASAGGAGGLLTHPLNYLRAQAQKDALTEQKPRSYWQILNEAGLKELSQGVKQRMAVTSAACVVITVGKKVMNAFFDE